MVVMSIIILTNQAHVAESVFFYNKKKKTAKKRYNAERHNYLRVWSREGVSLYQSRSLPGFFL